MDLNFLREGMPPKCSTHLKNTSQIGSFRGKTRNVWNHISRSTGLSTKCHAGGCVHEKVVLPHGPHGSQHSTETRQGNSCQADPSDLSFHKKSAHKPWKIDMLNPKMEVWFRWFLGYMLILRGVTGLIGKQDRHVFLLSNNLGTSRMVVIHNFCAIYERNP